MNILYDTKKIKIWLLLIMSLCSLSISGCGAMTERQMHKIEQQYEKGKVTELYYYEDLDAYYNGEQKPPRTFIGRIWRGITNLASNVIGFIGEIIGLIILILILRFIFGKR